MRLFTTIIYLLTILLIPHNVSAQENKLKQEYEVQTSFSDNATPLWLNANKYGLSSLSSSNGYVRGNLIYTDTTHLIDWSAGIDIAAPIGYKYNVEGTGSSYTQHIILQQYFLEAKYKLGELTIGAKQRPMELKDNELSSGSQTFGINSRPVPQITLGLADYWNIPYSGNWLAFKGRLSFGIMTDGNWQCDFANNTNYKYNKSTRYHEKAGYLRLGNESKFPLSLTLGLEMAAQFGGTLYNWEGTDQAGFVAEKKIRLKSNFKSHFNVLIGSGSDNGESQYQNSEGNQLGSWVARLNWNDDNISAGIYADHFFEDHSSMFFLDYDGYGENGNWDVKEDNTYLLYGLKDIMLGGDITFKKFKYINKICVEYISTRYQSGPIYHDHTSTISDHIGGRDNYYNHSRHSGWQHWGQVIGNPFYTSPLYNGDGFIGLRNNRFLAWNFAFAGDLSSLLHYRARLSWERGWGTYDYLFIHPKEDVSWMLEATYTLPETSSLKGLAVKASLGADYGKLLGDNTGCQFTVSYKL